MENVATTELFRTSQSWDGAPLPERNVLLAAIDVVCAGGIALTAPAHRPSALIPTDDYLFPLSLPPEGDESAVAPRSAGGSDQLEHTR